MSVPVSNKAAPCKTIPENTDTAIPFGTIAHYCWRRAEPRTAEDRCGTVVMVIGPDTYLRGYRAIELHTLTSKQPNNPGRIIGLSLSKGSPHHIAEGDNT
jgi:hypothetical protein